jgi:predicted O-methyltransferase YrrM
VRVQVAGRAITADLNAKSVRKAIATIRESGADNVACILQGKLEANDVLAEAGLAVKVKPADATPPQSQ